MEQTRRSARAAARFGLTAALFCLAVLAPPASALRMRVRISGPGRSIPTSFLGLSVEVNELQTYLRNSSAFDRVISLLRPAAGGPVNLRVGGKSADDAYWDVSPVHAPPWVFEIDQAWLSQLAALAHRDQLHVTLGLNLAVHSPTMASSLARSAWQALGPNYLTGLAIGNEPDLYRDQPGLAREWISGTSVARGSRWVDGYSASDYRRDYLTYARALAKAAPGVPLVGPEITHPDPAWLAPLTRLGEVRPRVLTVHRYPFSSCWPTNTFVYPRFSSLLSERASAGLAHALRGAIRDARHARLPLWLSEVNSASCGGKIGITDTFATALWAPDLLFELLHAGVAGVNWHMRPGLANAPFLLRGTGIRPLPELYGLALFTRMMGAGAHLEQSHVRSQPGVHVKVWAVGSAHGLSVLLINKGRRAVSVWLRTGSRGRASVEHLTSPWPRSLFGIRLGGQWIGEDARWHGHTRRELVKPRSESYRVLVRPYSAVLLQAAGVATVADAGFGAPHPARFPVPAKQVRP